MESDFVLEYFTESSNIKFLYNPKSYYNQLCSMIKNAKEKVVISCLYIGTLPLEQDFVNNIVYAKKNNPDLIVELLLDKNRSLRRENTGNCILDLMKPLLMLKNVKVCLYHSPLCDALLNKVLRPPYSEVLGTLHMKIYVADSVTVISGANCSTPYFTTRMDRYMVVDDLLFSNVMHTVVSTLSTMAFRATPAMGFEWDSDLVNPLDDYLLFKRQIHQRLVAMIKVLNEALEPILMEKVEKNQELESKRSRTSRFFNKLSGRKANSSRSSSNYGVGVSAPSTLNSGQPSSARSVNGEGLDSARSDGSLNSLVLPASNGGPDARTPGPAGNRAANHVGLNSHPGPEYANSVQFTGEYDEYSEALVGHGLSGDYLLAPHMFSTAYNNVKGSISSRLDSAKYSGGSGRSAASSEHCQACDSHNVTTVKSLGSLDDLSLAAPPTDFGGVCYTPHKIHRKYPPMNGFARFMVLFQFGFSDPPFRQDELLCKDLMIKYRKAGHSIVLATSYLNFTDDYSNLCTYLLDFDKRESGSFYVVTSSPTSNDFNNCTDKKRIIPRLYCHYQSLLVDFVLSRMSKKTGSQLENKFYYEYQNPGYTFHHKGIWMFHGDIPENARGLSFSEFKARMTGPCAMFIGSSNISRRSQNKDLEMTVVVESSSVELLDQIKFEVYDLFKNSTCMSRDTVSKRSNLFYRILAFLLRQYF